MKKRNPFAVFIFSLITLGIYDLYWLVQTKKVLNQKTRHHIPTIWLLIAPGVILIVGWVMFIVNIGAKTSTSANSVNTNVFGSATSAFSETANSSPAHPAIFVIGLILFILGIVATTIISLIWFYKYSKAVNEYTNGKMSTAVSFLVLWLIHIIGVALIQDSFNDVLDGGGPGSPQAVPLNPVSTPPVPAPYTTPNVQPPSPNPVEPPQPPTTVSPNQPTNPNNQQQ